MKHQLNHIQNQSQILSQTQLQFLSMLAMNNIELEQWLYQQFTENPMIEKSATPKETLTDSSFYQNRGYASSSRDNISYREPVFFEGRELFHYLTEQLRYSDYSASDWKIITFLIYNLDEKGFFTMDLDTASKENGYLKESLKKHLNTLQELEPYGIFSSGIAECYLIQLKQMGIEDSLLTDIISSNLEDLLYKKMSRLHKQYKISSEKVQEYHQLLSTLKPFPLQYFKAGEVHHILPDVICALEEGVLVPKLPDASLTTYSLSDYYLKMMQQTKESALKNYLAQKYTIASNIIKNVENRKNTLLQITNAIIKKQSLFFYHKGPLLPMSMAQVAELCEVSTSTVSRAVNDKYLQYPGGMILMKELFAASSETGQRSEISLSPKQVKDTIRQIIKMENPKKPLSDDEIADTLKKEGIPISRRTVAKYRTELYIPTSRERRQR